MTNLITAASGAQPWARHHVATAPHIFLMLELALDARPALDTLGR